MRERGELPMEHQNLNQEQKLRVALCGPLPKTERTLLRRGDVEIIPQSPDWIKQRGD